MYMNFEDWDEHPSSSWLDVKVASTAVKFHRCICFYGWKTLWAKLLLFPFKSTPKNSTKGQKLLYRSKYLNYVVNRLFFPNLVEVATEPHFDWRITKLVNEIHENTELLSITTIQATSRDIVPDLQTTHITTTQHDMYESM